MELFRGRHPILGLSAVFLLWKALLLLVALASPGPGYDSSTTLLHFSQSPSPVETHEWPVLSKLVRWDAIYFIQIAQRGHVFEQEWAFGKGLSTDLSWHSRSMCCGLVPSLNSHTSQPCFGPAHLLYGRSPLLEWFYLISPISDP
jgi:phosphatidylinositol glycan class V